MTEWLPEDHLAWFLIDVVAAMDTTAFHAGRARTKTDRGRAGFDPDMLVTLLLYGYAHRVHSSRQIERLCTVDVAFRVICAQDAPDHTTIARFRADHEAAFTDLFEQVLIVCAKAGLGRVGVIAVDGTKIAANASVDANRTEDRLRAEVERIVAAAAKTDAAEDAEYGDARGDELPTEMAEATGRVARIRDCLTQIDAEKATVAADRAAADAKAAARLQAARDRVARAEQEARAKTEAYQAAWAATGRRPNGRGPTPPEDSGKVQRARDALVKAERRDSDRVTRLQARDNAAAKTPSGGAPRRNVTDPDSRIMPTRRGWIQGYNAQLAVTDDHLIIATRLTQDTVDLHQCQPMIAATTSAVAVLTAHRPPAQHPDPQPGANNGINTILFDAGYLSDDNLTAPGPPRLIALGKYRDQDRDAQQHPADGDPADTDTPIEQMRHRLRTPAGRQTYQRRAAIVEPVIGHLKDRTGLRTFSRRGLTAATSELHLAAATTNLVRLHRTRTA